MKNLSILLAVMFFASCSNAQKIKESDVPATVKTAFQKQHPDAKAIKWEKENGNYEVEFEVGETDYSVLIDASGNILETEIEISSDALPAKAKEYVSKNYAGQKIKEAAKITDTKGTVTYEAEIKGTDLLFDSNGVFIKEVKE